MRIKGLIIFIIFVLLAFSINAQEPDLYLVNVKGKITSAENGEVIPYAHIINPKEHSGTISNTDGLFYINLLTEDTLIIKAIGFVDEKFYIEEFPPKNLYEVVMKPIRYLLHEIDVTENINMRKQLGLPEFEPLNIPTELRGDAFNEKPPWYVAFLSPISFLQYHTSAKEKHKRETLRVIHNNEEWMQFSTFYNLENIKKLTGLDGAEADNFMFYCNINNRLPYWSGQIEIEFQIMDFYFKYRKEKADANKVKEESPDTNH